MGLRDSGGLGMFQNAYAVTIVVPRDTMYTYQQFLHIRCNDNVSSHNHQTTISIAPPPSRGAKPPGGGGAGAE